MKSIRQTKTNEQIIKNSTFINILSPLTTVDDFESIYDGIKTSYKGANHYTYAYLLGDHYEIQKYSDDGEPNKTAGFPMLEVLKKQNITNILCVTIRYFGGIKLGAGGLTRAYSKSVSENIKDATFTSKESFTTVIITIPFDQIGHTEHFLRTNFTLDDTTYDNLVHYHLEVMTSSVDFLKTTLQESTNGVAIVDIMRTEERYI